MGHLESILIQGCTSGIYGLIERFIDRASYPLMMKSNREKLVFIKTSIADVFPILTWNFFARYVFAYHGV